MTKGLTMHLAKKRPTRAGYIKRMVERIVQHFYPDQIILFGSHGRGDAGPNSDVDLLVVLAVEGSIRDKRLEIRRALHDIPVPLDIVASRPEAFAWRKDVIGTIEWEAMREGKILYANARGRRHRDSRVARQGRKRLANRGPHPNAGDGLSH